MNPTTLRVNRNSRHIEDSSTLSMWERGYLTDNANFSRSNYSKFRESPVVASARDIEALSQLQILTDSKSEVNSTQSLELERERIST